MNMISGLSLLKQNGFYPMQMLDIGAYHGDWSTIAKQAFACPVRMFEANAFNESWLQQTCARLKDTTYTIALLGAEEKEVDFWVLDTGSSVYEEFTSFPRTKTKLVTRTLDSLTTSAVGPLLIKLDVQGSELDVLQGGLRTLSLAEVVIAETSLLPYNKNAPLFAEVVAFMRNHGFVVYDFCGQMRRQSDNALFQTDVVFVRESSRLRKHRPFFLAAP